MKVGVIGLGTMGSGMAMSLLRAGHDVTVYNRSAAKAEPLVAAGATLARDPVDMGTAEAVLTMLSDDAAERELAFGAGLVDRLPPATIHLCSSTIGVETARMLAEAHARRGRAFVSAPVSGRGDMAAAGELFVLVSGPSAAVRRAEPVFEAIGQRTFDFGDQPGAAHSVKLGVNFMLAASIEVMGEAFALVERLGVDGQRFAEFFSASMFAAPAFKTYGDLIARQAYLPANCSVLTGLKDIRLIRAAASEAGIALPFGAILEERLVAAIEDGLADHDWAVMARRPAYTGL